MDLQHDDLSLILRRKKETEFLRQIIKLSWVFLCFSVSYQLIFFPDITNIVGMTAVVFAWIVTTKIFLQANMLQTYLLSTFMILGFVASQFYFPLLFTTLENKPLIYNLEMPEDVFLHATLCLLVLSIAHAAYRFLMKVTPDRPISLLQKAGFFDSPTHLQLWLMGLLGMASSFYVHLLNPEVGQGATGDPAAKFLQALALFTYAPFFIPVAKLYGSKEKIGKAYLIFIGAYAILLFVLSIAQNSRGTFIFGLTTPAFAYILGLLLGVFKTRLFTFRNFVLAGIVFWLLTGPLTDLGTAMLIVRDQRNDVSPTELLRLTMEALDDKKAIEARQRDDRSESIDFDWDERYLDNIFTARFANIKFNDASLITYSKVGTHDPDMQDFSVDQLLAALPSPVLQMFNFDVDKETLHALSFGDYLYVLSGGYGTPTGWRVGHVAGTGMATFGWWYLLCLALVVIPIFYLNDKFFRVKKDSIESPLPEERFKFSFCGVLALTSFYQFFLFETVVQGVIYLMRGWIQLALLYFIMFHITKIVIALFVRRKRQIKLVAN